MTKQEIKEKLAYNKGKLEIYKILYAHTNDNRHKKHMDNCASKVEELEIELLSLENPFDNILTGAIDFTIKIMENDFGIGTEYIPGKAETVARYNNVPALIACADYLIQSLNLALPNFEKAIKSDPKNETLRQRIETGIGLVEFLTYWAQSWAKIIIEIEQAKKPKIITDLTKIN